MKFKTNIKCNGCLDKVTPQLNDVSGVGNWEVDLKNPEKVLSINTKSVSEENVMSAVRKVGFEIEPI